MESIHSYIELLKYSLEERYYEFLSKHHIRYILLSNDYFCLKSNKIIRVLTNNCDENKYLRELTLDFNELKFGYLMRNTDLF